MTNKKAIITRFGGPDVIRTIEENIPEPQAGEVRISIEAAAVNTTDAVIRKGIYPPLKDKLPLTLGYSFVGKVDKIGKNVSKIRVGQRVAGLPQTGSYATYLCLPADKIYTIPEQVASAEAASLVLPGMTAYQMLAHFKSLNMGDKVLIHGGSGAVGNMLLQLGSLMGLQMTATASTKKLDTITQYGAQAIDYTAERYYDQLKKVAGDGFDAVFDFTNQKSFEYSFKLLKSGGSLITYAAYTSAHKIRKKSALKFIRFGLDYGTLMLKIAIWQALPNSKSAHFFNIESSQDQYSERFQEDMDKLFALLQQDKIKPVIYQRFALDEANQAHTLLDGGKAKGHLIIVNE